MKVGDTFTIAPITGIPGTGGSVRIVALVDELVALQYSYERDIAWITINEWKSEYRQQRLKRVKP